MSRSTWIDTRLDEVRDTIEQQAARLQSAANQVNQSATALAAIPAQFAGVIDAINAEGTAEQKSRLAAYMTDFQAVKGVAQAATARAEVQVLRDLEV